MEVNYLAYSQFLRASSKSGNLTLLLRGLYEAYYIKHYYSEYICRHMHVQISRDLLVRQVYPVLPYWHR